MIRDRETLELLLASVRRFVRERLVPNEQRLADEDAVPPEIVAEMRELGLFGLSLPEAYGGLGLTMEEEVLTAFELARTSPAFRTLSGTNNGIGSQGIVIDGTQEQKRRWLPRLASGEIVGAFALTEPGAGSDAASLCTTARREGDHYVLNGTKRFITNAPEAGIFTVMARTDPTAAGAAAISAIVVEHALRHADAYRRDVKPPLVEDLHRRLEADAFAPADQVRGGHAAIGKDQLARRRAAHPQLVFFLTGVKPRSILLNDNGRDPM